MRRLVVNRGGVGDCALFLGQIRQITPVDSYPMIPLMDTMFVARPNQIKNHPTVIDFARRNVFSPRRKFDLGSDSKMATQWASRRITIPIMPAGFVERGIDRICKRIPSMENGALHSAHGGYDGIHAGSTPDAGRGGPRRFFISIGGFSGTGFKTAPAVGLCMSELI